MKSKPENQAPETALAENKDRERVTSWISFQLGWIALLCTLKACERLRKWKAESKKGSAGKNMHS